MLLKWRPFCLGLNVLRVGGYRFNEYIISFLLDLWNIKGHPIPSSSWMILTSLCIQVFNLVSAKRQEIMVNVLWRSHTVGISDRWLPCVTRLFSVAKRFTECYSCLFFGNIRLYLHIIYHVSIFTWRRYLKPFLLGYKIHLLCIFYTAATENMATLGASTSTVRVMTQFAWLLGLTPVYWTCIISFISWRK